jgi:hypothetical protein
MRAYLRSDYKIYEIAKSVTFLLAVRERCFHLLLQANLAQRNKTSRTKLIGDLEDLAWTVVLKIHIVCVKILQEAKKAIQ